MGINDDGTLPVGFGMTLGMNVNAMKNYSALSEAEKEDLLNRARDAKSKNEMSAIVDEIAHKEQTF